MTRQELYLFYRWLQYKGIFREFATEFVYRYDAIAQKDDENSEPYSPIRLSYDEPINQGLIWARTKQGRDFWYQVNSQWMNDRDLLKYSPGIFDVLKKGCKYMSQISGLSLISNENSRNRPRFEIEMPFVRVAADGEDGGDGDDDAMPI